MLMCCRDVWLRLLAKRNPLKNNSAISPLQATKIRD
jgi:hypothetical protein